MEKYRELFRPTAKKVTTFLVTFLILLILASHRQSTSAQDISDLQTVLPANETPLPVNSTIPPIGQVSQSIHAIDSRTRLIDDLYSNYNSAMAGLGSDIVAAADKYGLPFSLLPAISFCESTGGKVMPEGSYNAWGWHIYGDNKRSFTSWEEAIETISQGLRENYLDDGLDTPAKIMSRYTPSSNGSWAKCVQEFMDEMQ